MYTVRELAEVYGVSKSAVRLWLKAGCPHKTERIIGVKDRIVLDKKEVDNWLETTEKRNV